MQYYLYLLFIKLRSLTFSCSILIKLKFTSAILFGTYRISFDMHVPGMPPHISPPLHHHQIKIFHGAKCRLYSRQKPQRFAEIRNAHQQLSPAPFWSWYSNAVVVFLIVCLNIFYLFRGIYAPRGLLPDRWVGSLQRLKLIRPREIPRLFPFLTETSFHLLFIHRCRKLRRRFLNIDLLICVDQSKHDG